MHVSWARPRCPPTCVSLPPLAASGARELMDSANAASSEWPSSTRSATDCCLALVLCGGGEGGVREWAVSGSAWA